MRRIIYLLIIVAAVGGIIAAGYYFRYRGAAFLNPEGAPQAGGVEPITLPPPPEGRYETTVPDKLGIIQGKEPTKIVAGRVLVYFIRSATSSIVFQTDGKVTLLTQNGAEVLSVLEIKDIIQAGFSSDGSKLMATFGKRDAPQASIFDVQSKSWRPFAEAVYSFAWSPEDSQIAYLAKSGTNYEVKTLDAGRASAKPRTLLPLHAEDVELSWPRPGQILVRQTPSTKVPGSLLKIDVTKRTIAPIVEDRMGLDVVWSGVSDMGLVFESGFGGKGGALRLTDDSGRELHTISFITLPEKCVFYGAPEKKEYLVCGAPSNYNLWSASALPDAYLKKEIFSRDWLYRVDLKTGDIEVIYDGSGETLDATDLQIKNGVLYFKNRLDGSLYGLTL